MVLLVCLPSLTVGCGQEVVGWSSPCLGGGDCAAGQVCVMDVPDGMCTETCLPDRGCAEGSCRAVGSAWICVPWCDAASPCRTGWTCTEGACLPEGHLDADADVDVDVGADVDDDAPDVHPEVLEVTDRPDDAVERDDADTVEDVFDEGSDPDDAGGGVGDPCSMGEPCRDPLLCTEGYCREAVQARFCHCLATGSGEYIYLTLHLNEYVFPPVLTRTCSPCQTVPDGRVRLEAYRESGSLHGAAWLDLPETTSGEVSLFATTSEFLAFDVGCSETMSCP